MYIGLHDIPTTDFLVIGGDLKTTLDGILLMDDLFDYDPNDVV
jgi:hypothetical protein